MKKFSLYGSTLFFSLFVNAAEPRWIDMHSIIGTNNLEEISAVAQTPLYDAASSIVIMRGNGFACTAFRVGPNLLMTNQHCSEVEGCATIKFTSRYEKGVAASEQKTFKCEKLLFAHKPLDMAVYLVKDMPEEVPTITLTDRSLNNGTALFLASHPMAQMKKIDQSVDCMLKNANEFSAFERTNITHSCDTMGGSSGSPVFDRATRHVVALHWGGNSNQAGTFNHAIPMKRVLEYISAKSPEVYKQLQIVH